MTGVERNGEQQGAGEADPTFHEHNSTTSNTSEHPSPPHTPTPAVVSHDLQVCTVDQQTTPTHPRGPDENMTAVTAANVSVGVAAIHLQVSAQHRLAINNRHTAP